jgi:hypothetical protein
MSETPKSARRQAQEARRERRVERGLWRRALLTRAKAGESRELIAKELNVSVSTVQRALTRARAEAPPETREEFVAAQLARLRSALALAEARIEDGDLGGAYALAKLLPLLERYDDQQRCLAVTRRQMALGSRSGFDD